MSPRFPVEATEPDTEFTYPEPGMPEQAAVRFLEESFGNHLPDEFRELVEARMRKADHQEPTAVQAFEDGTDFSPGDGLSLLDR